jgi:hypothetical protein
MLTCLQPAAYLLAENRERFGITSLRQDSGALPASVFLATQAFLQTAEAHTPNNSDQLLIASHIARDFQHADVWISQQLSTASLVLRGETQTVSSS